MLPESVSEILRRPFPPEAVRQRPVFDCQLCKANGPGCAAHAWSVCPECDTHAPADHQHVDYVGHAFVRERLNEADPGWTWQPMGTDERGLPAFDRFGGLWIVLKIAESVIPGYGHAGGLRGPDGVKAAVSDALRNAAMPRGVALDMWKQERTGEEPVFRTPDGIEQTPEDRQEELKGQIRAITKAKGWGAARLEQEYAQQNAGQSFRADDNLDRLAAFKLHAQNASAR
jgi:hypothetical protein